MTNTKANIIGTIILYLTIVPTLKVCGYITIAWWFILMPIWIISATIVLIIYLFSQRGLDWSGRK